MSSFAFVFNIIISCLITLVFLYRCGNYRRQHPITTGAVFISWLCSIMIVFILPLDISLATYRDCLSHETTPIRPSNASIDSVCPKPWSYIHPNSYKVLWNIVYWASQILTWLVLPLMQSFCETGEFYLRGKILYAIKTNLIYYGTLLIIFILLIIYVATKVTLNSSNFMATIVAASTTWGLFLLVLMLGYGLVEVPKSIYNHSRTGYILSHIQFKLSKLYNEKVEVEECLENLVDELAKLGMQINLGDPLKPCLDQIIKIVPEEYSNRIRLTLEDYENNRIAIPNRLDDYEMEQKLIKLNEKFKKYIHIHHRVQVLWLRMINEAFYLEDIFKNQNSTNPEFVKENPYQSSYLRQKLFNQHPKIEWYIYCVIRPWTLRFIAILFAVISLLIIWSEMTFFSTKTVLSILAQCLSAARNHYSYFTIEVFCCLSIAYLCLCAYYTVFRIRILNYFYVSLYHLTDENSLLFAAMVLCRLTAPLCYNFLGMIHLDQAITHKTDRNETIFTSIMGHLTAIPIVSIGFNFYFPMLICLLSIGTFFQLGSRCLHKCGFRQFFDDDDLSAEYVEDGKSLMNRERRNHGGINTLSSTTTAAQRRDRRRELEEKYGLRSDTETSTVNPSRYGGYNSEARRVRSSVDEPLLNPDSASDTLVGSVVRFSRRFLSKRQSQYDAIH